MRLPPKPILIRIVIYGSLIGIFGWRACARWSAQQEADEAAKAAKEALKSDPRARSMKLDDGTEIPVVELTPEEARREFGVEIEPEPEPESEPAPAPEPEPEPAPEPRVDPRFAPPSGDLK